MSSLGGHAANSSRARLRCKERRQLWRNRSTKPETCSSFMVPSRCAAPGNCLVAHKFERWTVASHAAPAGFARLCSDAEPMHRRRASYRCLGLARHATAAGIPRPRAHAMHQAAALGKVGRGVGLGYITHRPDPCAEAHRLPQLAARTFDLDQVGLRPMARGLRLWPAGRPRSRWS